jgi:phosphoglycolate phosphatase-like HAD superfamily hydrolase
VHRYREAVLSRDSHLPDQSAPPSNAAVSAVLWDIDGTLLSSGGVVAHTFLDAVQAVCGTRPDPAGLEFGGRLDPEIAALLVAAVSGRSEHVEDVLDLFATLVAEREVTLRGHVRVLPGVRELVSILAEASVAQTVVTGNLESVGRFKLYAAELIPPIDVSLGGFGASGTDRAAVARVALDRLTDAGWQVSPSTCWVVGDTPRDLACARALGLRCALVATGRHTMESLAGLGADLVLPALTDDTALRTAWFG